MPLLTARRVSTLTCTDLRYDDHVSVPAPTRHRPGTWPHLNTRCNMPDGTCSVDGCDRTSKVRRMCQMHYVKWWSAQPSSATRGKCADEEDCDRVASRRGLCEKHYRRLMRVENGA